MYLIFSGISLTTPLNRNICVFVAAVHDLTIIIVLIDFQAILLFLVAHTSTMYSLLAEEMNVLSEYKKRDGGYSFVKENLPHLIHRHVLLLKMVKNLKSLYNNPLGVNFGLNAVFLCLFFYLPLRQWYTYSPTLIYCFAVFFLYCYLCQKLINASVAFEKAVYSCGWEDFRLEEKRTVYVILKLAQRPIGLLAADMIPVNMYTFAYTLQSVYKFVTIMKT